MSDVNLVKLFARSIERLQRGEVARLRLVGFRMQTRSGERSPTA